MKLEKDVKQKNMPGGKAVILNLTNWERAPRRAAQDLIGTSGPRAETP